MDIAFDSNGVLNVPSDWFEPNHSVRGKVRSDRFGRVQGIVAPFGVKPRYPATQDIILYGASDAVYDPPSDALVHTSDGAEIPIGILAYGPDHFSKDLGETDRAIALVRVYNGDNGVAVAGCIHPAAVAKYGQGPAIGMLNATAFSIEGKRSSVSGRIVDLGSRVSAAARRVIAVACVNPSYPISNLVGASDSDAIILEYAASDIGPIEYPAQDIRDQVHQYVQDYLNNAESERLAEEQREVNRRIQDILRNKL